MPLFLAIFVEFFKTGLFSIGGGLATLPFLFAMTDKYNWFTATELTNMIAVSESTPGPIGVNIATYVGFKIAGLPGAIYATLSLVLPSIIVIIIIAGFLEKFRDSKIVKNMFFGLRPAVVGMLAVSFVTVLKSALYIPGASALIASFSWVKIAAFAVLLFLVLKFKKHPILYIAIGAVVGIIFKF